MADRVHPADSPPRPSTSSDKSLPSRSSLDKPGSSPGTYVVQIRKDQVYGVPPPENAKRFEQLTRRKHRRSRCRCCVCSLIVFLAVLVFLLGVAAGVFYLVVRPKSPNYSINAMTISGINLTSSSATGSTSISPQIDVLFRADNPNKKIGIYYERQSSAVVYYSDVKLCEGALPVFYQPSNNETLLQTKLIGSAIELSSSVYKSLYDSQNQGKVPLEVDVNAPVKLKIGSLKTWKITFRVSCEITVDKLAPGAKILSQTCDYNVKLW